MLALMGACGTAESRSTDDGRRQVENRLQRIETDFAGSLSGDIAKTMADGRDGDFDETYAHLTSGDLQTWDLYLRSTGRDSIGFDDSSLLVGGCVRLKMSKAAGASVRSIPCPQKAFDETRQPPDVEIDLVDGVLPLVIPTPRPSFVGG